MKKLLKWLLLLSALLSIGIATVLYNPGLVRGPLENYLSKLTGYSIQLDGELTVRPGRHTTLIASEIRVSNPAWEGNGELATLGVLDLTLDTSSVFENTIVLESLRLVNLKLTPETNSSGMGNWVVDRPASSSAKSNTHTQNPVVIIKNITLNNTSINYLNGKAGVGHVLHIAEFHQHQQSDGMLQISLAGALNESPVEYTGKIGPFTNLLKGRDINFSGAGHFGSLEISGQGLIDKLPKPRRPTFSIQLQGPNIDKVTTMLGVEDLGNGAFSLLARGEETNGHYGADIRGNIGDIAVDIATKTSALLQMEEVELKLAINGPSLGPLTRAFGLDKWPDEPFSLKGDVRRVGSTLDVSKLTLNIGSAQLTLDALLANFPNLDAGRVKLSAKGDDIVQFRDLLGVSGIANGPFELHGNLDVSSDGVELVQVDLETSIGRSTVFGTLGPAPSYIGTRLHVEIDGNDAHEVMSAMGIDALPNTPFKLDTHVELEEKGLRISRGVLVSIGDDRLELGGLIALGAGGIGTDIEIQLSGGNLSEMLRRLAGDLEIPARPYALSAGFRILDEGFKLSTVQAEFEDIKLSGDGLIRPETQFVGTNVNFQLEGGDLSSLNSFSAMGNTLDHFAPGQAFQTKGRFKLSKQGWELKGINGQVGQTVFDLDGLINPVSGWDGTNIQFSINGPALNLLLAEKPDADWPSGPFNTKGAVMLSAGQLKINDFLFKTDRSSGTIDLEMDWPASAASDIRIDLDVQGEDIRHFLPPTKAFKPAISGFHIKASGQRKGELISLQEFDANIGDLLVSLEGSVAESEAEENIAITFSAVSPDISTLGRLNGELLPAMPLNLRAVFNGNASQFTIQDLVGTLGDNHISGSMDIALDGPKPQLNMTLSSNYIDIRPFTSSSEPDDESAAKPAQTRLIQPIPIPLEALAAVDGAIHLELEELRHENGSLKDVVLQASLNEGHLVVPQLLYSGARGQANIVLSIRPAAFGKADVNLELRANKLIKGSAEDTSGDKRQAPVFDIILVVEGSGADLQELAGSLNGSLLVGSEGGAMEGVNLSLLDTFILERVLSIIMPKTDKEEALDLHCAAAIVKITNGLMKTKPAIAFTTNKITMVSKGSLDLKTERIKFNFNATPNKALAISAGELFNPYILVGGTLLNPSIGVDPAKALLHGGAAVGTAGISILAKGLLDRVGNSVPVCQELLEKVQQQK